MRQEHRLIFGVLTLASLATAFGDLKGTPYHAIVERNAFGLRPIPLAVAPPADPGPPPIEFELKLTGIGTLVGPPKAFLELIETKTKKTERLLPLAAGEEHSGVQIVSIDAINQTVSVRLGEAEMVLNFEKNGYKPGDLASAARSTALPLHSVVPPLPVPGISPPRSDKVLVGGEGKPAAQPPLSLEDARKIIELRREEMERSRPGSSVILPPTPSAPPSSPQPGLDSGTPVRFRSR